jgi:hypothetical protein
VKPLLPRKSISITYLCVGGCVCARACFRACAQARGHVHVVLLIQHATCIRHVVASFLARLAAPYFSTVHHEEQDVQKKSY